MRTTVTPKVLHTPLLLIAFPRVFLPFTLPIVAKNMGASAVWAFLHLMPAERK